MAFFDLLNQLAESAGHARHGRSSAVTTNNDKQQRTTTNNNEQQRTTTNNNEQQLNLNP